MSFFFGSDVLPCLQGLRHGVKTACHSVFWAAELTAWAVQADFVTAAA